jgi:hypothetical protein
MTPRLMRTKLGHFCLCIPKPLEVRLHSQKPAFTNDEKLGVVAYWIQVTEHSKPVSMPLVLVTEREKGNITRIYRLRHVYMMIYRENGVKRKYVIQRDTSVDKSSNENTIQNSKPN